MRYRTLGKTNYRVSEIGFGAWGIGRTWWGTTDDSESIKALKAAWDAGVTFFDTAYVYGDGHSERLIAEALNGKPAIVATKIPPKNNEWPPKNTTPHAAAFPADWIVSCTERSLKNLKREALDLSQFHVWSDHWLEGDWMETIAKLKTAGKIKAFGISINDHDPDSALRLVDSGLVDTVQVIFNIFDQTPAEKLLPRCQKNNVGVIARVPFDEGSLTGTFTKNTTFERGDFRRQYFQGENLPQTLGRVEKLRGLLDEATPTLSELALKFILGHDAVSSVIPGMRQVKHVEKNVAVSEARALTLAQMNELKAHAWPRNFYTWWDD